MDDDGQTCKLIQKIGQIVFSAGHEIRKLPLFANPGVAEDTKGLVLDISHGRFTGLDHNGVTNEYIYVEHDSGLMFKADPTPRCLISGLFAPQAVAVDWVGGRKAERIAN